MGGAYHKLRNKGPWTSEEVQELKDLVQENLGEQESIRDVLERDPTRLNSSHFNWEAISSRMMTRSSVDCRLKWHYYIYEDILDNNEFTESEDLALVDAIEDQGADEESEINFTLIKGIRTSAQNRNRFRILCRAAQGRESLSLDEIL